MPPNPENPNFFKDLKCFQEFSEITNDRHYRPVPAGWCVIITDVKGSTKAIESGRYKDVNTIGAASIATVQNALGDLEFPYVFGGDGATLLIPNSSRHLVTGKLAALKNLSLQKFSLELRVGIVEVSELLQAGRVIEVAKFELFAGKCMAGFRGGGLTHAESLIKGIPDKYEIPEIDSREVDLAGLSCRWNPIPNKNGCVLSMLVVAEGKNEKQVYDDLFEKLQSTFSPNEANPVNPSLMSYRSVGGRRENERRFHAGRSFRLLTRYLEIVAAVLIFKWKIPPLFFKPKQYVESMRTHSDYRKFDDMLRMIIDCTPAQVDDLTEFLEGSRGRGELSYGLHCSETALMTCYVHGIRDGNHIHFIDGGNGGYAIAAKQLKSQLKAKQ